MMVALGSLALVHRAVALDSCANHLPKTGPWTGITLTPYSPQNLNQYICLGSSITFTVTPNDVDAYGEPIPCQDSTPNCKWYVDNVEKGSGPSYEFTPTAAGTYTVKCEATDGGDTWQPPPNTPKGYDAPQSVTWTLYAVGAEVKAVIFTSDHGVMTDWDSDYAGSGGTVYNPRGWRKTPPANNPISHTKGLNISANVVICVQPAGVSFTLDGDGPVTALDFSAGGQTSTGSDQTISVTSTGPLEAKVYTTGGSIVWTIKDVGGTGGPTVGAGTSGPHTVYVTWDTPADGTATVHRIKWVCNKADGQTTKEACVDAIWHGVAGGTTFGLGPPQTDGWALLDGGRGDCDNQARCMSYAVLVLGAGPAEVDYVRASTDEDVSDLETRYCSEDGEEWLYLDFDPGPGMNRNNYEGCCRTSDPVHWYAITPEIKADSGFLILCALANEHGVTQWWFWDAYELCTQDGDEPVNGCPP
jgi:hypothetical protein